MPGTVQCNAILVAKYLKETQDGRSFVTQIVLHDSKFHAPLSVGGKGDKYWVVKKGSSKWKEKERGLKDRVREKRVGGKCGANR